MKGYLNYLILFIIGAMFTFAAFAQIALPGSADGSVDWAVIIGQAIANPKALTAAVIGCLVVLLIVQALKSNLFKNVFKKVPEPVQFAIITILGQCYAFAVHVFITKDQEMSVALVGLFSSGGAASIFRAVQLLFIKKSVA